MPLHLLKRRRKRTAHRSRSRITPGSTTPRFVLSPALTAVYLDCATFSLRVNLQRPPRLLHLRPMLKTLPRKFASTNTTLHLFLLLHLQTHLLSRDVQDARESIRHPIHSTHSLTPSLSLSLAPDLPPLLLTVRMNLWLGVRASTPQPLHRVMPEKVPLRSVRQRSSTEGTTRRWKIRYTPELIRLVARLGAGRQHERRRSCSASGGSNGGGRRRFQSCLYRKEGATREREHRYSVKFVSCSFDVSTFCSCSHPAPFRFSRTMPLQSFTHSEMPSQFPYNKLT